MKIRPSQIQQASASSGQAIVWNGTEWAAATVSGYTDEQARDAIGAALVAGSNITITVNDPADTITIGSSAGSGFNPIPVDDPTNFGSDLGFDYEFGASTSSLPSGWSWVNQGTATYNESYGAGVIDHPGAGGDDVKAIVQTIPGSSSFLCTAKVSLTAEDTNYVYTGIVLRDSASGKLIVFGFGVNRGLSVIDYTSPTVWSSNRLTSGTIGFVHAPQYLRVRKNSSTSWDFQASADGVGWRKFLTASNITGFMTPNQIGFAVHRNGGSQAVGACHWFRIR